MADEIRYIGTGKFLTPEDVMLLNDLKLVTPIFQALGRLMAWTSQSFVTIVQEKYKLDKKKHYEVASTGEIMEPENPALATQKTGVTIH